MKFILSEEDMPVILLLYLSIWTWNFLREYLKLHPKAVSPYEYMNGWDEDLKEMLKNANGRQVDLIYEPDTLNGGELYYRMENS